MVTASEDRTARVWDLPPRETPPPWLADLAEFASTQVTCDHSQIPDLDKIKELRARLLASDSSAQVDITTWQVNLQHTGNNASETILTPGNISSPGNFGLLFSQTMDGMTAGQPLLVSGLTVAGATHNVVYAGRPS